MIFDVEYLFCMKIMDTSLNLVFLQEYNEKQIKQQEKKQKMVKSPESRHSLRKNVATSYQSRDIS